ncbi:hypothetical protein WOA01_15275 [Methylocystis sp. IM2]|uniref:hypothetical protein n=1 Tax=unclassified Methylocystis TaxID=2625913 RepID=UPI0030FC08AA
MAKLCGLPPKSLATVRLDELARVAEVMRAGGEILPAGPWLKTLANILSALPPKAQESRRGRRPPSVYLDFSAATLAHHACRCGLECTPAQIRAQIAETTAWRRRMSDRARRSHRLMISMDAIGRELGITEAVRTEAKAWNLGTYDGSPEARERARSERKKQHRTIKRRAEGATPRADYERHSLSRTKPWESEGISRRTWYSRRKKAKDSDMGIVIDFAEHLEKSAPRRRETGGKEAASGRSRRAGPQAATPARTTRLSRSRGHGHGRPRAYLAGHGRGVGSCPKSDRVTLHKYGPAQVRPHQYTDAAQVRPHQ